MTVNSVLVVLVLVVPLAADVGTAVGTLRLQKSCRTCSLYAVLCGLCCLLAGETQYMNLLLVRLHAWTSIASSDKLTRAVVLGVHIQGFLESARLTKNACKEFFYHSQANIDADQLPITGSPASSQVGTLGTGGLLGSLLASHFLSSTSCCSSAGSHRYC